MWEKAGKISTQRRKGAENAKYRMLFDD